MELPQGQRKLWNALLRYRQQSGNLPLANDLSRITKLHLTTVLQHLEALQTKGLLELNSRGRGRSMELGLTLQGRLEAHLGIPLLGKIQAGPLSSANQEVRGLIQLPSKPGHFALEIVGFSMSPWLQPQDIAIVKSEPLSFTGQVAVVQYHDETTLKKVFPRIRKLRLESVNPDYPPFTLPADEVEVKAVYSSHFGGELAKELLEVFM